MDSIIRDFKGENFFLSNFYKAPVTYNGLTFGSSEAAYQAQKCKNKEEIAEFTDLDPSEAKKRGRHVALRDDWENEKVRIMYEIVYAKFSQNSWLKTKLLATGDSFLIEGNNWGDHFWGMVDGKGRNYLGRILMDVRDDLRKEEPSKKLVVIDEGDGKYSGHIMHKGPDKNQHYGIQVFHVGSEDLFKSVRDYTNRGYVATFEDKKEETVIWRYAVSGPMSFGKSRTPIGTKIKLMDYDVCTLHMGFEAVVIEKGPAKGIYELKSGGMVGDTVEQVNSDIDASGDIEVMNRQIEEASNIRKSGIKMLSNEEFGIVVENGGCL